MGVRLVRYNRPITGNTDSNTSANFDHDELINRDLANQHPIYAITGLLEFLNILEDAIDAAQGTLGQHVQSSNNKITAILKDIDDLNARLDATLAEIAHLKQLNFQDSESVIFSHDAVTNTVTATVRVFRDPKADEDRNAIQELATGLFVPKFTSKDSTTISWKEEVLGETLSEIFVAGSVFSHYGGTSNIANSTEANAWYWDDSLKSFVQPKNTTSFTGFVTQNTYDYYTHSVQIRSTDSDNDLNGLVIGYVTDSSGHPHTLTAVVDRGGLGGNKLCLFYNYQLTGQTQIASTALTGGNGAWSAVGAGITLEARKYKNEVTVVASNWNSTTLNEATRITIDLNDYAFGAMFSQEVKYGYCNQSQAYSFFQNASFISSNVASSTEIIASVNISKEPGNSLQVREDGLYAETIYVSPDDSNALEKRDNGYYVRKVEPAALPDNALQALDDGSLYVREYSNVRSVTQANHALSVGDFIYYHPNQGYQPALAIDSYDSNIVGMVTAVINSNTFEYQWSGFFATDLYSEDNGYVQGMPLYISNVDAGKVLQEQPDISKTVGYPVENKGLVISVERGIQYNMEASIGDFKVSANTFDIRSDGFIRVIEGVNYKQSLVNSLLNTLDEDFKSKYIAMDNVNQTMSFINTEYLYITNSVIDGFFLFIKAF